VTEIAFDDRLRCSGKSRSWSEDIVLPSRGLRPVPVRADGSVSLTLHQGRNWLKLRARLTGLKLTGTVSEKVFGCTSGRLRFSARAKQ
jgi:hypothetical protein